MLGILGPFAFSLKVSFVVAAATALATLAVAARARRAGQPVLRPTARTLAIGSALVILTATGLPFRWPPRWEGFGDLILTPGKAGLSDWRELIEDRSSLAAVLLVSNVLLYIPLALFGTLGWPSRRRFVLAGCLMLSVLVEAAQLLYQDRIASVDDVLLNSAGAVVGYVTGATLIRRAHRVISQRSPRRAADI